MVIKVVRTRLYTKARIKIDRAKVINCFLFNLNFGYSGYGMTSLFY